MLLGFRTCRGLLLHEDLQDRGSRIIRQASCATDTAGLLNASCLPLITSTTPVMESLPVELLHKIFEPVCSPTGSLLDELPDEDAARLVAAPCTLAAVCRDWRDICMRTPQIWSFIHLNRKSTAADLPYIHRQLERSADVSIDFVLTAVDEVVFQEHLQLLATHARRWRRATITFTAEIPSEVCALFQQPMPRLEQLRLLSHDGVQSDLLDNSWDPESSKKYLKMTSRLDHLESHIMIIVPSMQWRSLRFLNYSLRHSVIEPLWVTLTQTPALEELNIFFTRWMSRRRNSQPLTTPLDLPMLQRLGVFGFLDPSAWPELLRAPRLETLTVSLESCNHLGALFRAPAVQQQVRHLTITTIERHDGGFLNRPDAEAMGDLQRLETLELRGLGRGVLMERDQTFFSYLAGEDGDAAPAWASRLQYLVLRKCQFYLDSCNSLGRYLRLRIDGATGHNVPRFDFEFVNTEFITEGEQDLDINDINSAIGSLFAGHTVSPVEVNSFVTFN